MKTKTLILPVIALILSMGTLIGLFNAPVNAQLIDSRDCYDMPSCTWRYAEEDSLGDRLVIYGFLPGSTDPDDPDAVLPLDCVFANGQVFGGCAGGGRSLVVDPCDYGSGRIHNIGEGITGTSVSVSGFQGSFADYFTITCDELNEGNEGRIDVGVRILNIDQAALDQITGQFSIELFTGTDISATPIDFSQTTTLVTNTNAGSETLTGQVTAFFESDAYGVIGDTFTACSPDLAERIGVEISEVCGTATRDSDGILEITIEVEALDILDAPPDDLFEEGEREPTCEDSDVSFAWVLCPVAIFSLNALETIVQDGVVQSILSFDSLDSGTGQRAALQSVWEGFRAIANVGFAIVFFILVFSAGTGGLMSSYDVKRLLPKVFIGAVLVQLSFFITTLLVGVFNALGASITEIMLSPIGIDSAGSAVDTLFAPADGSVDYGVLGSLLRGLTSAIILILIIIGALTSILGVIIMVLVFLVRNIVLIVLTVLSPIAFVAWILPNTQKLFSRWWQFYIQLLALFPIAMAFLASGRLISYIWVQGDPGSWTNQWLGMIALFLPYLMAPKLFSFAGSALGGIVGGVENARKTIKSRTGQVRDTGFAKRAESKVRSGAASRISKRYSIDQKGKRTPAGFIARSGTVQRATARAQQTQAKIKSEDIKAARVNVDANRIESRKGFQAFERNDDGTVKTLGGRPVPRPEPLKQDAAEIEYLTQVLESDRATAEEQAAAVNALLNVHSPSGDAALAVNNFMLGLEKESLNDSDKGELYYRIIDENGGDLKAIPHLAYSNTAGTIGKLDAREFHSLKAGSVQAFMRDPGASDAMVSRVVRAANDEGTERQMIRNESVTIMYTYASDRQRELLETQFNFEQVPEFEENGDMKKDQNGDIIYQKNDDGTYKYIITGRNPPRTYDQAVANGDIDPL